MNQRHPAPPVRSRVVGAVPLMVLALVAGWNAWSIRAELLAVTSLNDGSFQAAYLRWATDRVRSGQTPFDGIFSHLGLGFPVFHHYQVLPHVLGAIPALVFGTAPTFRWIQFLLITTWPGCVYWMARRFDRSRWAASMAGVCSLFLVSIKGYGFERSSYLWSGYGMWTQAWGMWFMPLAVGAAWHALHRRSGPDAGRNVREGRRRLRAGHQPLARPSLVRRSLARRPSVSLCGAGVLLALALSTHVLTGYQAALMVLGLGLVARPAGVSDGPDDTGEPDRAGRGWALRRGATFARAVAIAAIAGSLSAWLLVAAWRDQAWARNSLAAGTVWTDSYGPGKVLGWLFAGRLFDFGRWPVVTVLVLIGAVAALWGARRDDSARGALVLFVLSVALYCGRGLLHGLVDLLPAHQELFLHRMITGVQLAGLLLVGFAVDGLLRAGRTTADRLRPAWRARLSVSADWPQVAAAVGAVAMVVVALPMWRQAQRTDRDNEGWIHEQRVNDRTEGHDLDTLLAHAKGGRVYAGTFHAGPYQYKIGFVSAPVALADRDVDAVGFGGRVPAITEPTEAVFDATNQAEYDLFDVRWLILPGAMAPPPFAQPVMSAGLLRLYRVATSGAMRVVDTTSPIPTSTEAVGRDSAPFVRSRAALEGRYPLLAMNGRAPGTPTALDASGGVGGAGRAEAPGVVSSVRSDVADGLVAGTVELRRTGAVVVPVTFHPRWKVTIDGKPARTQVVAPGLLAVTVGAGRHRVEFRYAAVPITHTFVWLAFGALVTMAIVLVDRRWLRGRPIGTGPRSTELGGGHDAAEDACQ